MPIFVHNQGRKVHVKVGRRSKNSKNMSTYLLNDPKADFFFMQSFPGKKKSY
jgi:hypothetical protein